MSSPFTHDVLTFWDDQYNQNFKMTNAINLPPRATTIESPNGNIYVEPAVGSDYRNTALFSAFLASTREVDARTVFFQAHDQVYNATAALHKAEAQLATQPPNSSHHTEILEAFGNIYTPSHALPEAQILHIGSSAMLLCQSIINREEMAKSTDI